MIRKIAINLFSTPHGDVVRYVPDEHPDGTEPPPLDCPVTWRTVEGQIDDLRRTVFDLTQRARFGQKRGSVAVEQTVSRIARLVLPNGRALLDPGVDVLLDTDETFHVLPWEMFEEVHHFCPAGDGHVRLDGVAGDFCPLHGQPSRTVRTRLGIGRDVWFKVRPSTPPAEGGRAFLMILDPRQDLFVTEERPGLTTAEDPRARAWQLHKRLLALLRRHFDVLLLHGSMASHGAVLDALSRRDLAGMYYHGHASPSRSEDGCFELSDRPLFSQQILEVEPAARLVFLNACWGAGASQERSAGSRFQPLAYAFARGPRKSVIGSLWPLENVQAAGSALGFFHQLLEENATVGEALRHVRSESLARYEGGEPDIGWMSYRLLGSPVQGLRGQAAVPTLFGPDGNLSPDLFAFGLAEVLKRALRRRNFQHRALLSVEDLVAGLLRKGDLLRLLCRKVGVDPDELHTELMLRESDGEGDPLAPANGSVPSAVDSLAAFDRPDRWSPVRRTDLSPPFLRMLEAVHASARTAGLIITERALLEQLIDRSGSRVRWTGKLEAFLPGVEPLDQQMRACIGSLVDENGCFLLTELAPDARKIVDMAHALAQSRGACPIPGHLILAAFLEEPRGRVATAWRRMVEDPELTRRALIGMTTGHSERSFAFSHEACDPAVRPMVQAAARAARLAGAELADERHLFQSFVQLLGSEWHQKWPVPLTEIASACFGSAGDPDGAERDVPAAEPGAVGPEVALALDHRLDEPARRVLEDALRLARMSGSLRVTTPHLYAALIGDGGTRLGQALRKKGLSPHFLKYLVTDLVQTPEGARGEPSELTPHAATILRSARDLAHAMGVARVGIDEILDVLEQDVGGGPELGSALGKLLRTWGVNVWR